MSVVALPVYRNRVAPVLDFSHKVLLIGLDHDREELATELFWKGLSQTDRLDALTRASVDTVICGGISESLHAMLANAGIDVIWGIAGPVDAVLEAFKSDRLNEPIFQMPGRRAGSFDQHGNTKKVLEKAVQRGHDLRQELNIRQRQSLTSSGITTKHVK